MINPMPTRLASERRQHLRLHLPDTRTGTLGLTTSVRLVDVSPAGARIEHTNLLAPGQACVLDVALADQALHLRGRVVWCQLHHIITDMEGRSAQYHSGIHFAAHEETLPALLIGRPDAAS